jgi:hypothetical protein
MRGGAYLLEMESKGRPKQPKNRRRTVLLTIFSALVIVVIFLLVLDTYRQNKSSAGLWQAYSRLAQNTTQPLVLVEPEPDTTYTSQVYNPVDTVTKTVVVAGLPGLQGSAGPVGPSGLNGVDGIDGIDGADGIDGVDGVDGVDGINGSDGLDGTATCPNGDCVSLQSGVTVQEAGSINVSGAVIASSLEGDGAGITNLDASQLNSGTVNDARLSTAVTLQGNTFNGVSQLVQTTGAGALPVISGVNLTNLNASSLSSGTVSDSRLSANVTVQGNTFNGTSQLVKTDVAGALPVISGVNLTNLNASSIASGTLNDGRLSSNVTLQGNSFNGVSQLVQTTVAGALPVISGANLTNLNASSVSSGTLSDSRLSSLVTLQGNTFNGISQLIQATGAGALPVISGVNLTNLNASNLASGTVNDARLSTNVTTQGNTFNGVSQLVQLTGAGLLPALDGSALTNLNASNLASGTVNDARLSSNVALLNRNSQVFTGNDQTFKNATNSTTGFVVQDSTSASVLTVNTSANKTTTTALEATTSLKVGSSGTAVTQMRIYTPTLNPSNVAAASTAEQTYTVTGLATNDVVYINKPSLTSGCSIGNVRVSATDTLAITWVNILSILGCDPPSEVYSLVAIRS